MFRYPDKLMEVKRKLLPVIIGICYCRVSFFGQEICHYPAAQGGSDEFMSLKTIRDFLLA